MKKPFNPDKFMIDAASADLRPFVGCPQLSTMRQLSRGEEKVFFITKMVELAALIHSMPKVYEQDGLGDKAVAYLHYFTGQCDWYITEKDSEPEQLQAFGYANLGDDQNAELGYISIVELMENGVELDLHFTPRTLAEIKQRKAA
mgnify:CR=1 FL=1